MTAPTISAVGTDVDETPAANSQALGPFSHTAGRGYLVTICSHLGSSTNPPSATLSGWSSTTFTEILNNLWRNSGTNRGRTQVFWCVANDTANSSITVTYTGVTLLSLDMLVDEVTDFDPTTPYIIGNAQTSGSNSIVGGVPESQFTFNALAKTDNRTFVVGNINGNDTTFDFDAGHTNLSTFGSGTAPTRRTITGWRNNATPDLTPSIQADSAWTAGSCGIEIAGTDPTTNVDPVGGTVAVAAGTANVGGQADIDPVSGSVAVAAAVANIGGQADVAPSSAAVAVTADTANVTGQADVTPISATVVVTAGVAGVAGQTDVAPVSASVAVAAGTADVSVQIGPSGGTVAITAGTANVEGQADVDPVSATVTVTAGTINIGGQADVSPVTATVAVTAGTAALTAQADIDPVSGAVGIAAGTANVGSVATTDVDPVGGSIAVTAGTATVTATAQLDPTGGSVTVTAGTASITATAEVTPTGATVTITAAVADVDGGSVVVVIDRIDRWREPRPDHWTESGPSRWREPRVAAWTEPGPDRWKERQ